MSVPYKNNAIALSESDEQILLFEWATVMARNYPDLNLLHAIPNGGARCKATAGRMKAEGVKSGVPDICLPVPMGGFHGLYVELKVGNNKPTDNQKAFITALNDKGYLAVVCYGWLDAKKIIEAYITGKLIKQN